MTNPRIFTKKNIGYDFDGVLHTDVELPNQLGERNPLTYDADFKPFDEIIDRVESDIKAGHNVCIITARDDSEPNRRNISKHLSKTKLYKFMDRIKVYFSNEQSKNDLINQHQINIFYDDSLLRIREIYGGMKRGELDSMEELYLVNPETKKWTLI